MSKKGAPGYQSKRWIRQDWRSVKVKADGSIVVTSKCGAPGTRTQSGKPHLCLPKAAIDKLRRSSGGRDALRKQARAKARAKPGQRVRYNAKVKEAFQSVQKRDRYTDNPRKRKKKR